MAGFFNCGFARVAAKNSAFHKNKRVTDPAARYSIYIAHFEGYEEAFEVEDSVYCFLKRSKALLATFQNWRGESKTKYVEHFGSENWNALSESEKKLHRLADCLACLANHFQEQKLFPIKSPRLKAGNQRIVRAVLGDVTNFEQGNDRNVEQKEAKQQKSKKETAKSAAKAIYNQINSDFEEKYGESLGNALTRVNEFNLQTKKTKVEVQLTKEASQRKTKKVIEENWKKIDCDLFLATRQSQRFVSMMITHP